MGLGDRIKEARTARKLTQSQLGERLTPPVTREAVSQWEKDGGTAPRRKRITDLARVLNVDEVWLIHGKGAGAGETPLDEDLMRRVVQHVMSALRDTGAQVTDTRLADMLVGIYGIEYLTRKETGDNPERISQAVRAWLAGAGAEDRTEKTNARM